MQRKSFSSLFIFLFLSLISFPGQYAQGASNEKKLLHLGHDIPLPSYIRKNIREMEQQSPFSGIVYKIPIQNPKTKEEVSFHKIGWGSTTLTWDLFEPALEEMKQIKFERFTDNFLRVDVQPADLDWFDDWTPIYNNVRFAARFARRAPNTVGIFLDTETYQERLFNYVTRPRREEKSLEEYSVRVKEEARKIMKLLQEEYPGIKVFLTYGYSGKKKREQPTDKGGFLLKPFTDGLLEAAEGKTVVIDGYEKSYPFKDADQFSDAREDLEEATKPNASHFRIAFALSIDWPHKGEWNPGDFSRHHFQPKEIAEALRAAMKATDEYVWLYGQQTKWFPLTTPPPYVDAVFEGVGKKPGTHPQISGSSPKLP